MFFSTFVTYPSEQLHVPDKQVTTVENTCSQVRVSPIIRFVTLSQVVYPRRPRKKNMNLSKSHKPLITKWYNIH